VDLLRCAGPEARRRESARAAAELAGEQRAVVSPLVVLAGCRDGRRQTPALTLL
jgi:hypothetical protein